MPRRGFEPVAASSHLFRFDDCCAVYLLKQNTRGILIDLGSGAALDHLHEVGVEQVDAVLFTHAHRDQCQGFPRALAAGIPLHFPEASRQIVDPGLRGDWSPPSPLVGAYRSQFEPPPPIPQASFDIRPGTRLAIELGGLEVLAVPGHSADQVAYLADIADLRAAFCGDTIHSPGKVHEPYHLETDHYTGAGCRQAVESLRQLKYARPNVLCPSHGPLAIGDLWHAFDVTIRKLLDLADLKDTICPGRPAVPRLVPPQQNRLHRLSDHLFLWNNSYFVLSQDGPVLMIDCGESLSQDLHAQWRAALGERPVEVVLVTHIHCDHVDGIRAFQTTTESGVDAWILGAESQQGQVLGVGPGSNTRPQVWAMERLAPLLSQPHAYRRPWLPRGAIRVDRLIADMDEFEWRGYQFHIYDFPGQTDLHSAYATSVDGRRVLFSGDNFYPPQQWGGTGGLSGLNGGHPLKGWRSSIELVRMLEPGWLLAAHVQPFPYRRADFEAMLEWTDAVTAAMRSIAPDGSLERHHDPHLVELFPYAQCLEGDQVSVTARVRNPSQNVIQADVALILPSGWSIERSHQRLSIQPGTVGEVSWSPRTAASVVTGTYMLTLDVVYEGEYMGQKAEGYVYVG